MSVRLSTVKEYDCLKEPYFIVSGAWLAEIGFKPGSKFIIETLEKGDIVIKLVEEEKV
jgi:hypothetical protein